MTIDDERAAFIRDLLRVLTSLYSWAGAVVHGQTEDGHDVIELCDGTRVWTERRGKLRRIVVRRVGEMQLGDGKMTVFMWGHPANSEARMSEVTTCATRPISLAHIRDLLSGPPEDA